MSISINRINIIEQDLTGLPVDTQEITDIAYVPGFAQTNTNIYILVTSGAGPLSPALSGTSHSPSKSINYIPKLNEYPEWCSNIVDKKSWRFVNSNWTSVDYIAPCSENVPVLCKSVKEFESNFGSTPYKFTSDETVQSSSPDFSFSVKVGDYDKSYIYAKELINKGIPVYYENIVNRNTESSAVKPNNGYVTSLYANLADRFSNIAENKNEYAIKYITSGAYPVYNYVVNDLSETLDRVMLKCACMRGDAIALIDAVDNPGAPLVGDGSVYNSVKNTIENKPSSIYESEVMGYYLDVMRDDNDNIQEVVDYGSFGTMVYPWAMYKLNTTSLLINEAIMPGSFGYMLSLGASIKNYANWLPIAGVARGQVPQIKYLNTTKSLTNHIADSYQDKDSGNINAITNIADYGLTIWGNRTLKNNNYNFGSQAGLTATSFVNIRNLLSDIKKQVYKTAKSLLFQPNTNTLWVNFKSGVNQILDKMVTGGGIKSYKVIRGESDEETKVVAIIKIVPVYAVEEFEVTIQISNSDDITVEG